MKKSSLSVFPLLLCGLPLMAVIQGCGGGSSSSSPSATPVPTGTSVPTATPTVPPASPVNFDLVLTKSEGSNYVFPSTISGDGIINIVGDQFTVSNSATGGMFRSNFRITLPRSLKAGDVISVGDIYASTTTNPLAGVGTWSGTSGKIVAESRVSRVVTLRFTKVLLTPNAGGDINRARGNLTFNGSITVKLP